MKKNKKTKISLICNSWVKADHRKYLWYNDELDMQAIVFTNDESPNIKCLWVKVLHNNEYISNYFVYDQESIPVHPLDYAINVFDEFKESCLEDNE